MTFNQEIFFKGKMLSRLSWYASDEAWYLYHNRKGELEGTIARAKNALTLATKANDLANTAYSQAINASRTASQAMNVANNAIKNSTSAINLANSAYSRAIEAYDVASKASSVANNAINLANSAKSVANQARNVANQALSNANKAWDQANNAINVANNAIKNAKSAFDFANQAKRIADQASKLANDAWNKAKSVSDSLSDFEARLENAKKRLDSLFSEVDSKIGDLNLNAAKTLQKYWNNIKTYLTNAGKEFNNFVNSANSKLSTLKGDLSTLASIANSILEYVDGDNYPSGKDITYLANQASSELSQFDFTNPLSYGHFFNGLNYAIKAIGNVYNVANGIRDLVVRLQYTIRHLNEFIYYVSEGMRRFLINAMQVTSITGIKLNSIGVVSGYSYPRSKVSPTIKKLEKLK